MKEEWRSVEGYEGNYEVSDFGNARSLERVIKSSNGRKIKLKGRILKQNVNTSGYLYVQLCKGSKCKVVTVHRLVAKAFIKTDDYSLDINHKDCDKKNNNVNNLEWVTRSENMIHAFKNGLIDDNLNSHKKPVLQFSLDGELIREHNSVSEANSFLGKRRGCANINSVCKKKRKTAFGYKWSYK